MSFATVRRLCSCPDRTERRTKMSEAATKTRITSVGNVGVPTTDQDRALEFYVGKLGFEKRRDVTFGPGLRWVEVAPPEGTTTVALLPTPPGLPCRHRHGDPTPDGRCGGGQRQPPR